MSVGEYCNREVVIAEKDTEIREAARLMRKCHVGGLVVVERQGEDTIPVGVVTDRDLVVEVLAQELEPGSLTVEDVMSLNLITARENDDLWDTLGRMRSQGIRRLPVVNDKGGLVGILTADDVLELLSEGLGDLIKLIKREIGKEAQSRQ
jgi:CBS domain-containing protein